METAFYESDNGTCEVLLFDISSGELMPYEIFKEMTRPSGLLEEE